MKKISLVVPCFNEASTIEETVSAISKHFKASKQNIAYELILVDDGSTDETLQKITNLRTSNTSINVVAFKENQGRGAAMKAGIKEASGDYIMFMDADLSYDVEHISIAIDQFEKNSKCDAIIFSPYMKGGVAKNIPFSRLMLSKCANWLLSGFFAGQISTVTSMVRAYKTETLRQIPLLEDGKELHLEILKKLYLVGANVVEVPGKLIWKEKKQRAGRLNKKKIASSARKHFLYAFLIRPTRFFGKISFLILIIGLYELSTLLYFFMKNFTTTSEGFWKNVWSSLSLTFSHSPHTVIIAVTCLLLSIQLISFVILFNILKMQQDETLRHLIALFPNKEKEATN